MATKRGFLPPVIHDDGSLFNEKRNKISHPQKSTSSKLSKKRNKINSINSNGNSNNNNKKSEKTAEKKSETELNASSTTPKNNSTAEATGTKKSEDTSDFVDPAIAKDFIAKYSVQPRPDMRVRCKVPGKESPMKGSLKYLGRISNLPKRSNVVVAGIQLEHEEDLGTDGTFLGKRYFTAPNKHGYFVPMKNCTPM